MRALACTILAVVPLLCSVHGYAENEVTSGEIEIEDTSEKTRSPQAVSLEAATEWLERMKTFIDGGGSGTPPTLDERGAQYMAVMYLYCIYKLGPCPFVLDTVLESDLAQARGRESAECPSMGRFWKAWLSNDLEQRSKYLLSIGAATAVANFNSVERPRYVKCKDTVATESKVSTNGRYGSNGKITQAVNKTLRVMKEINDRQIDIFSTLGVTAVGGKNGASKKPGQ